MLRMLIAKLHSKCFFVAGFCIGLWYGAWMRRRGFGDAVISYYRELSEQEIDKQFPDDKPISLFKWAKSYIQTIKRLVPQKEEA